jgi:hypothetical protein
MTDLHAVLEIFFDYLLGQRRSTSACHFFFGGGPETWSIPAFAWDTNKWGNSVEALLG